MKVQCSNCSTNLMLRQAPASGKIKCPKCASIVNVGSAAALPTAASTSAPGEFDFGSLSLPPANEPTVRPFQSTILVAARPITKSPAAPAAVAETASKPSDKKMAAVSVGVLAAIVSGIISFYVVRGLVGGSGRSDSSVAEADANADRGDAPDGYKQVDVEGVTAYMPDGEELLELPQALTCKGVLTPAGTVFFLASTAGNNTVVEGEKLQQKATRLLGGGIIGGSPCERNGYTGNKFVLDQCLRLPDMNIEVYQIEGRFIVIGVSKESLGEGGSFVVGQSSEPEKQTVFFDSLTIGPKPSKGFW